MSMCLGSLFCPLAIWAGSGGDEPVSGRNEAGLAWVLRGGFAWGARGSGRVVVIQGLELNPEGVPFISQVAFDLFVFFPGTLLPHP